MAPAWSEWSDRPWESDYPYVDWYHASPPAGFDVGSGGPRSPSLFYLADVLKGDFRAFLTGAPPQLDNIYGDAKSPKVPLPGKAINDRFSDYYKGNESWAPRDEDVPVVDDPDTVIVGIIDTGIALGHNRFRDSGGGTRFLASWQQTARHNAQPYLPFGAELYQDGIDALLSRHSVGGLGGCLNEAEFNDAAGLIDMKDSRGHRELAGRYAHGTTVADLAVGERPGAADSRVRVIAVNLPDRATVQSSGIFLDYFAIYGIRRIATLADLIFDKSRARAKARNDAREWPAHGFKIIINLSFCRHAGAKDGSDFFSACVREINDQRAQAKPALLPIQMVIPIGNHNLRRGCAEVMLPSGAQDHVTFITQPEDQTHNFLEIWTEQLGNPQGAKPSDVALPLEIDIIPPGGSRATGSGAPSSGGHLKSKSFGDVARLYCTVRMGAGNIDYKVGYLFCTAPTLWQESPRREASPSGRWTIVLRNAGDRALRVHLSIQTDQSILPSSDAGRIARLERPDYEEYETPSGRRRDSYGYPSKAGGNLDNSPVLRRHGSINAMAAGNAVVAVAGFRLSDGRPAVFSSTGHGYKLDTNSRAGPTVSFPTDESPAHFGLLGAGAANGSVVAMRGTSFAAGLATRWIVRSILDKKIQCSDLIGCIGAAAQSHEKARPAHYAGEIPPQAKIGQGRMRERPARQPRTLHPP